MKPDYIIGVHFIQPNLSVKGKNVLGICKFFRDRIDIYVDPRISWTKQILVLMHELAHACLYILGPHRDMSTDNQEYFADSVSNKAEETFIEILDRPNI